jgi:nucleoside-diphosphate-sugar epimerase
LDSPYQISKVSGEMYGNYYHARHGVPFVKARFQNVYGPGEVLGAGRWRGTPATVWRNVTPTFVYRALTGQPLLVENEQATRDFIYVDDIADGLVRCALHGKPGDVYNLASGCETTILELAQAIVRLAGSKSEIKLGERRAWDHSGKRYGSMEKAARELEFFARTELDDGLRRTIQWQRENRERIDACIQRHANYMQQ